MSESKRRWWEPRPEGERKSKVESGYEVVEQDEDGDWIDTFRFSDYRADRGMSSVDSIWNRYGYSGSSLPVGKVWRDTLASGLGVDYTTAKRIEAAQKLVQGFVDTFALDNPLRASFDDQGAVGGAAGEQNVVVSHRPLLDPTLSTHEAHEVMTAQAANAAARARYGGAETKNRRAMIRAHFNGTDDFPLAEELGEILDGYRIDASFRRDYPGYEEVYAPAQRYVAKGLLGDREAFDLEDFQGSSIANAALNYSEWTDWTGRESERDYWRSWADQYAFSDDLVDYAKGVREAIQHLNVVLPPPPPKPPKGEGEGQGTGQGEGQGEGSGQGTGQDETPDEREQDDTDSPTGGGSGSGQDDSDEQDGEDKSDGGQSGQTDHVQLPTSLGKGVSLTGLANGQSQSIDERTADQVAKTAEALVTGGTDKEIGEVYWNTNGFPKINGVKVNPKSAANGYIRRAFSRSRTAHYASERGHVTGRIDNRSLPRIASDDYRLFAKRVAPSETRYRVWLLIDNSGSMAHTQVQSAADLAASVALAVRHIPNVAFDVWAWTSGIRVANSYFSAIRVYANGDPVSKIADVLSLPQGGTPDNMVLSWATREIRKQCRPDETPVIIMASDGQGGLAAEAWWSTPSARQMYRNLSAEEWAKRAGPGNRVEAARKKGIKVLSVAIGALDVAQQDAIYGKGNHLVWRGSIRKMAKPLGDLLARVATSHG